MTPQPDQRPEHPTPWTVSDFNDGIKAATGEYICHVSWEDMPFTPEAFRRIVACVNACAGIETWKLEAFAQAAASLFVHEDNGDIYSFDDWRRHDN